MPLALCGQTLAPLGPPARQNFTAIFIGHARTKAMAAGAFQAAGLESTFHFLKPSQSSNSKKRVGISNGSDRQAIVGDPASLKSGFGDI